MKRFTAILFFAFLQILNAQITITIDDVKSRHEIGDSYTEYVDTVSKSIDIGKAGTDNYWDFSGLNLTAHFTYDQSIVDPSGTEFENEFPLAEWAIYVQEEIEGNTGELWWYGGFPDNKAVLYGYGSKADSQFGTVKGTLISAPADVQGVFPMTLGTTWDYSGVETLTIQTGIIPVVTTDDLTVTYLVDASGIMKLPDGRGVEALRLYEVRNRVVHIAPGITEEYNEVLYTFFCKGDEEVSLTLTNIDQPNSGVINIDAVLWNNGTTTAVEDERIVPETISLKQNYPNPFNPSTTIEYTLNKAEQVQLKIYDILGNEVASLVNEFQSAGNYKSNFSGAGLASGNYIIRFQAGNYSEVKKMTLLK